MEVIGSSGPWLSQKPAELGFQNGKEDNNSRSLRVMLRENWASLLLPYKVHIRGAGDTSGAF